METPKYLPLEKKYNKIKIVSGSKKDVIRRFINGNSHQNIKAFPVAGVITYEDYQNEYFNHHKKISSYYGHLSQKSYEK